MRTKGRRWTRASGSLRVAEQSQLRTVWDSWRELVAMGHGDDEMEEEANNKNRFAPRHLPPDAALATRHPLPQDHEPEHCTLRTRGSNETTTRMGALEVAGQVGIAVGPPLAYLDQFVNIVSTRMDGPGAELMLG